VNPKTRPSDRNSASAGRPGSQADSASADLLATGRTDALVRSECILPGGKTSPTEDPSSDPSRGHTRIAQVDDPILTALRRLVSRAKPPSGIWSRIESSAKSIADSHNLNLRALSNP
jgi:hypothetical protein